MTSMDDPSDVSTSENKEYEAAELDVKEEKVKAVHKHVHEGTSERDTEEPDEEEDDEYDSEGEEEPKLKYQRLGGDVVEILKTDTASCLIAHEKFLVLGTHKGFIHVLDLNGNKIMALKVHKAQINGLSLDNSGDYVASCSDDGTVAVTNLYSREHSRHTYPKPVRSVALPSSSNYKPKELLAIGGTNTQLILTGKGRLFGFSQENIIHSGEGPIHAISWKTDLIAWGNDTGVKIYDHVREERITYVQRKDSLSAESVRCHLCWATEDTLLIGWGNSVTVGVVKDRSKKTPGASSRFLQIVAIFTTEYLICGIAPFGEYLVLLSYVEEEGSDDEGDDGDDPSKKKKKGKKDPTKKQEGKEGKEPKAARPELRVVTWTNEDISSDALPIRGYEKYAALDYRLDFLPGVESLFYIVSPSDIVVARPRDVDDHISWLLQHELFHEALKAAQANPMALKQHKVLEIGNQYLQHLMEHKDFKKAAEICPKLLGEDSGLWETWITVFASKKQISAIGPVIPITKPTLRQPFYEMVLASFLDEDQEGFLRTIRKWPQTLYKIDNVITTLKDRLKTNDSKILMEALGELYIMSGKHRLAVHVYLTLGRKDVFKLVTDLNLFDAIQDKLLALITFDKEQAIALFLANLEKIPVEAVVRQLQTQRQLLHEYLHALFKKDASRGVDFHALQVQLYAEFDSEKLLPFLRNSNSYTLEDALHICQERNLYPEQVFLLKRMGNTNYALILIIEKLKDVKMAIDFVEEHKDPQLWEELITRSLENPEFLADLLEHAGSHYVDLSALMKRIPNDLQIPDLKKKLVKIFSDCALQRHVMAGCNNILQNDCISLQTRLHRRQQRAVKIGPNPIGEEKSEGESVNVSTLCAVCNGDLFAGKLETIVTFFCHHSFHSNCFESQRQSKRQKLECLVCSKHRRIGSLSTIGTSSTSRKGAESPTGGDSPPTSSNTPSSTLPSLTLGGSGGSTH